MATTKFPVVQAYIPAQVFLKAGVCATVTNSILGGRKILWIAQLSKSSFSFAFSQGMIVPTLLSVLFYACNQFPRLNEEFGKLFKEGFFARHPNILPLVTLFGIPVTLSVLSGSTLIQAVFFVVPSVFCMDYSSSEGFRHDPAKLKEMVNEFKTAAEASNVKDIKTWISKIDLEAENQTLITQLNRVRNKVALIIHPDKDKGNSDHLAKLNDMYDEIIKVL